MTKKIDLDIYTSSLFHATTGMYGYYGDWGHTPALEPAKIEPKKCECGTTITMGAEDHPRFHQDYCPIFKKEDNESK